MKGEESYHTCSKHQLVPIVVIHEGFRRQRSPINIFTTRRSMIRNLVHVSAMRSVSWWLLSKWFLSCTCNHRSLNNMIVSRSQKLDTMLKANKHLSYILNKPVKQTSKHCMTLFYYTPHSAFMQSLRGQNAILNRKRGKCYGTTATSPGSCLIQLDVLDEDDPSRQ